MESKIRLHPDDYKQLLNKDQNEIVLRFEKECSAIKKYILSIYYLPKDLLLMIIDYSSDTYFVTCLPEYHDTLIYHNYYTIKQIINNQGEQLLNYKPECCGIFIRMTSEKNVKIMSELNMFKIYEDTVCNKDTGFDGLFKSIAPYDISNFFNYFMEKYYNKKTYINCSTNNLVCNEINENIICRYSTLIHTYFPFPYISRKINNKEELKNIIDIFKILSDILIETCTS